MTHGEIDTTANNGKIANKGTLEISLSGDAQSKNIIDGNGQLVISKGRFDNEYDGTLFKASEHKMNAKSHWVLYKTNPKGYIYIDNGAKKALCDRNSLLSVGVTGVKGVFDNNDVVGICNGKEILAKGIVSYNSEIIEKIKGKSLAEVKKILGDNAKNIVIHANNIVLLEEE